MKRQDHPVSVSSLGRYSVGEGDAARIVGVTRTGGIESRGLQFLPRPAVMWGSMRLALPLRRSDGERIMTYGWWKNHVGVSAGVPSGLTIKTSLGVIRRVGISYSESSGINLNVL